MQPDYWLIKLEFLLLRLNTFKDGLAVYFFDQLSKLLAWCEVKVYKNIIYEITYQMIELYLSIKVLIQSLKVFA
jgi:hypothetical protein